MPTAEGAIRVANCSGFYGDRVAAAKEQVAFMVRRLLPGVGVVREDETDALAVALCHAHRSPGRALRIR